MSMLPHRPASMAWRLLVLTAVAVVAGALVAAMALPFVAGAGLATRNVVQTFESLPESIDTPPLPERTQILAADGSELATLYYENRVEVPLASVSPTMRQAIVAVEDERYLNHNGVDLRSTVRALAENLSSGQIEQGSSTITMQYVKNILLSQADDASEIAAARGDTASRKLREMRYALALERRYTKAEILERYLNIVYFGAGAHGVEAAARRYFSKPASELTLTEAATLAGIVQRPTAYDPLRNPDLSERRRNTVLARMEHAGFITKAQKDAAVAVPVESLLAPSTIPNGCTTSYAPFFCDFVMEQIRHDPTFGETAAERENFLRRGGYTIVTTLDPKAQAGAFESVTNAIPIRDESARAAAITMIEPGTGNVLAMAQNREWGTKGKGRTTYNYNVDREMGGTIGMQAGSTFKIFTMAAALEAGISPFEYVSSPSSKTFTGFVNCETGVPWPDVTVRNSTSSGTFDMARGTAYSVNTYFMAIEERTGLCRPAEIAESMGVFLGNGEPLLRVPSFTLGSMEVTPLAMSNAFATFAAHGMYCKPRTVTEIRDREGRAVQVSPPQCTRVVSRDVADSVAALLTGVIDGGIGGRTGAAMSLPDRPAAGKTGTTNESAAVWFSGFTPDIAASVWVGDPRGGFAYPMKNVTVNGRYYSQVFGSTMPGPIWKSAMITAHEGKPTHNFELESSWGLRPARTSWAGYGGTNSSYSSSSQPETTPYVFDNSAGANEPADPAAVPDEQAPLPGQ